MNLVLFFSSYCCLRSKRCLQDHGCFVEEEEHGNLNILGSPLAIHQFGKELQMVKINLVSSIPHVGASLCVESSALVCIMEHAVKNTAGRSNCYLIGIEGGLRESMGDFSASSSIEIGLGSIMLHMTYEQRSCGWNRSLEWTIAPLESGAKRKIGMDSSFFAAGMLLGSASKWSLSWIKADSVWSINPCPRFI